MVLCPKDIGGMAQTVEHDQSNLGLQCFPRPVCPII